MRRHLQPDVWPYSEMKAVEKERKQRMSNRHNLHKTLIYFVIVKFAQIVFISVYRIVKPIYHLWVFLTKRKLASTSLGHNKEAATGFSILWCVTPTNETETETVKRPFVSTKLGLKLVLSKEPLPVKRPFVSTKLIAPVQLFYDNKPLLRKERQPLF